MPRASFLLVKCLRRGLSGVAALALWAGAAHAEQPSVACKLLQVAELETALGGKVTTQPTGSRQAVPGMTLDECSLVITVSKADGVHPVSLRLVSDLSMDGAQALQVQNRAEASEPQWKVAGARLEQGTVGSAVCMLTGRPSVASHTKCSVPRGSGYVELDVIGNVDKLPSIQTVGALVAKAVSRL